MQIYTPWMHWTQGGGGALTVNICMYSMAWTTTKKKRGRRVLLRVTAISVQTHKEGYFFTLVNKGTKIANHSLARSADHDSQDKNFVCSLHRFSKTAGSCNLIFSHATHAYPYNWLPRLDSILQYCNMIPILFYSILFYSILFYSSLV